MLLKELSQHIVELATGIEPFLDLEARRPEPIVLGRHLITWSEAGLLPEHYRKGGPHFRWLLTNLFEAQLEGGFSQVEEAQHLVLELVEKESRI